MIFQKPKSQSSTSQWNRLYVSLTSPPHFGQPVKGVELQAGTARSRGEFVISTTGLEGGGIYGVRDAIDLDEVSLTVNTADAYGGGMMILGQLPSEDLYPYGTLTVSSSQINSNEALHGGGLKIVQVDSQIRGGEISHNTASGYAGGVLHEKSELELTAFCKKKPAV